MVRPCLHLGAKKDAKTVRAAALLILRLIVCDTVAKPEIFMSFPKRLKSQKSIKILEGVNIAFWH